MVAKPVGVKIFMLCLYMELRSDLIPTGPDRLRQR